jgi:hypothetical protein
MALFPALKSGVVLQYPTQRSCSFSTHIVRFLDGSEQRFRERRTTARRWLIRLELLDEMEIAQLEAFYLSNQGQFGTFEFPDPWDLTTYPNCSFENPTLEMKWASHGVGSAILIVKQNEE